MTSRWAKARHGDLLSLVLGAMVLFTVTDFVSSRFRRAVPVEKTADGALPLYLARETLHSLARDLGEPIAIETRVVRRRSFLARLPLVGGTIGRDEQTTLGPDFDRAKLFAAVRRSLDPIDSARQGSLTRAELARAETRGNYVLLTGTFEAVPLPQGEEAAVGSGAEVAGLLRLVRDRPAHLEVWTTSPADQPGSIEVELIDQAALLPDGRRLVARGESFRGDVLARAYSFEHSADRFICGAIAVWERSRRVPATETPTTAA